MRDLLRFRCAETRKESGLWLMHRYIPLLLPFFWIVRGLRAVFFRRRSMKVRLNKVRDMTPQSIQTYEQRLQLVGLDFHGMEEQA